MPPLDGVFEALCSRASSRFPRALRVLLGRLSGIEDMLECPGDTTFQNVSYKLLVGMAIEGVIGRVACLAGGPLPPRVEGLVWLGEETIGLIV